MVTATEKSPTTSCTVSGGVSAIVTVNLYSPFVRPLPTCASTHCAYPPAAAISVALVKFAATHSSSCPKPLCANGKTRGMVRDTPFVVTDMSPLRMNSMLAETSAFVSRFCAASDHATRHELDGVSSAASDETSGTIAMRRPVSATKSAERRRGLA